jgi:hypothetical protein
MSSEKDNKITNIESSFKNGTCSFCKRKFSSDLCLLPYSLIKSATISAKNDEMIEDVTMIHTTYGDSALNNNLLITAQNFENLKGYQTDDDRFTESSHNKTSTSIVSSVPYAKNTNKFLNDKSTDDGTQSTKSFDSPVQSKGKVRKDMNFTGLKLTNSNDTSSKMDNSSNNFDDLPTPKANSEWTKVTKQNNNENHKESINKKSKTQVPERVASKQKIKRQDDKYEHIITDLCIAFGAASQLERNDRTYTTVDHLFNSIEFEMDLISRYSKHYKATTNTTLDHTNCIAKEIAGTHTTAHLLDWKINVHKQHPLGCMLSYSNLTYENKTRDSDKLHTTLLQYIRSVQQSKIINVEDKQHVFDEVRNILETRDMPSAYPWCQSKISSTGITKKAIAKKRPQSVSDTNSSVLAFPILDNFTSNIVRTIVPQEVKAELLRHKDEDLYHDKSVTLEKFYTTLTREFIARNVGWKNTSSFQTKAHISKLLSICRFDEVKEFNDEILSTESNILQKVRMKSRQPVS